MIFQKVFKHEIKHITVFCFKINFFFPKLVIVGYQTRLLKSKSCNQFRLLNLNLVTKPGFSIQNLEPNHVTPSEPRHQIE